MYSLLRWRLKMIRPPRVRQRDRSITEFRVPNNFDGAGYVFWDERHPTTSMHSLIADQVFTLLNEQARPPAMNNASSDNGGSGSCFIEVSTW